MCWLDRPRSRPWSGGRPQHTRYVQVKEARGRLENIEAQLELSIRDMVVGAP